MADTVYGKSLPQWFHDFPLLEPLVNRQPVCWFNPAATSVSDALGDVPLTSADVADASQRLQRFAPFLRQAFPELEASHGIIESELVPVPTFAAAIARQAGLDAPPSVLLKLDSHLPVAGSVKARGGIYEVLYHAEQLALRHGLLRESDDYRRLLDDDCQQWFRRHKVAVGSTGNLGMSIGIASARLGFDTTVHMSADARQWKKDRLRAHGVRVVEYDGDYGQAVAQGRREAQSDPSCHFIDDENSTSLFLGYAVAGERLKAQFAAQGRGGGRRTPAVRLPAVRRRRCARRHQLWAETGVWRSRPLYFRRTDRIPLHADGRLHRPARPTGGAGFRHQQPHHRGRAGGRPPFRLCRQGYAAAD